MRIKNNLITHFKNCIFRSHFIININKDEKDRAFVNSIVTLAKELRIQTIAEFVENEEIVQILNELEIDYYQGYHIGKPSNKFISLK
jgi:EAL domain-containing protein (putative c-di-GMP-specific phosphodiesterase class I)